MTEKLTTYDPSTALVDDEEIVFFMVDAFETGDASYIAKALDVVARAKGMTEIAQKLDFPENSFIDHSVNAVIRP